MVNTDTDRRWRVTVPLLDAGRLLRWDSDRQGFYIDTWGGFTGAEIASLVKQGRLHQYRGCAYGLPLTRRKA